uniref:Cadherin-related neuronal receptor 11 n=1 Tax=Gallus gallus TaxID=9031 RepID=Q6R0I1_CHICK|nr:cadherin-related neuronal receptor 11 [Gallus gallus]|eukprot:NP_001104598.1 protocadherin alpha-11 precursor [Gallus gallus]
MVGVGAARRSWAAAVVVLQAAWALVGGQVRYSVPEEAEAGTVVGRLAQDLGLEAGEAEAGRLRLVARGRRASVEVSGASGALVVSSRLDREELCGKSAPCALRLEVLLDRPLRVFHVEVEVTDINDNAPRFPAAYKNISIAELSLPGSRFPLEGASDADIGSNAQLSYKLSPTEHFTVDFPKVEEDGEPLFLVLTKPLDRESLSEHRLVLTASDGGRPALTGTVQLVISVLDANDNAPQFNQSVYKVLLPENTEHGTFVLRVNAMDLDEGTNCNISYSLTNFFPPNAKDIFEIEKNSGEIHLIGSLDFEEAAVYRMQVDAQDKGNPPLSGHCKLVVEVLDVNDNAPEVWVTSLSVPVPEDAALGTVVALLSVSDRDSGPNGRVRCAVRPPSPFGLVATFAGSYSLVLREALDRERVSEYEVEVRAEDGGAPPLRASRGLRVPVSDVNDNAPAFAQAVYTVLARENNAAGAELARLWARDPDEAGNGRVSYSVAEGGAGTGAGSGSGSGWRPASSYVSVDAESGRLRALRPLDYEELQVLQFEVRAVDAGEPPLCGNATVQLFVVDENDNAPALLPPAGGGPWPWAAGEAAEPGSRPPGSAGSAVSSWSLWARAAWGAPAGQVVAKIRAVDADSGYNAWLRYELREPRGEGPFRVGLYSGEVSTARALEEADGPRQRLLIVVRDHGEPPRSATATLSVSLVEGAEAALAAVGAGAVSVSAGAGLRPAASAEGGSAASGASAATNVWLVVAICAVSSLLVLAVVLYGAGRWAPRAAVLAGPGPATLVCASEVGSWSYSQRQSRSLCVATDGAGKSDLMVFSPNCPPAPGPAPKETPQEPLSLLDTPKHPNPDWRYSASLRAGMQRVLCIWRRQGSYVEDQEGLTSSGQQSPVLLQPEAGEVSPPVGAGVNSNSWTFKFGPSNSKQGGPGELPDKFIIPGSPAIISIRQEPPNSQIDKSDFITFGKKEETKKKKKKKKGNKTQEKKEKGNSTTENSDQ